MDRVAARRSGTPPTSTEFHVANQDRNVQSIKRSSEQARSTRRETITMAGGGTLSLILAILLLVIYVVVWSLSLLGLRTALHRYASPVLHSRLPTFPGKSMPGVSIIRPLCGLDTNLYAALESTMKLEYPKYEVIFAVQDPQDESLAVVRMLMEKYPDIPARIVVDDRNVGVNPKINNLMTPVEQAGYDLLWVIDATISIAPGALGRSLDAFLGISSGAGASSWDAADLEATPLMEDDVRSPPREGDVGLVHHVPFAVVYQRTWGSLIEQAFLNTTHAKMYLAINAAAIDSCVMGKSNLYSRSNIASLTSPSPTLRASPNPAKGLAGFGPFLAEDNMIALSLWHELRLKHAMTSDVALDFIGAMSIRDYISRRVRWIRVRKRMTPIAATMLEPFTESIVSGLCGSWAIARLVGANIPVLWAVHMLLWVVVDLNVRRALAKNVRHTAPQEPLGIFLLAWAMREVMALPIFAMGVWGNVVTWRGRRYRILQSGEAERVDGPSL